MVKSLVESGAIIARIDWGGIVRIFVIQVAVLLAILVAAIRYIDWASDAAQGEFISVGKPTVSIPQSRHQPNSSQLRCELRKPI
jgi:hypothetical protein